MDTATPEESPVSEPSAPAQREAEAKGPKRFDFRHPSFLSTAQSRRLRMEVDEFSESLGALLSTYLRLEFTIQAGKIEAINFNEFTASAPSPTHLTLFKLDPLRGISILEMDPALAMGVADRLLGGPGIPATTGRTLTEMEIALMDQFVQILLDDWCRQWSKIQSLRAEILGHENNPRFLQSSSGGTVMLAFALDARMGDCVGQIRMLFPCSAMEVLVQKLGETAAESAPAPAAPAAPAKWNQNLDKLPLTLTAFWPSMKIPTRELMKLKPGEMIELRPEGVEEIELRVGAVAKFKGRMGARDNKRAIQITSVCKI